MERRVQRRGWRGEGVQGRRRVCDKGGCDMQRKE